MGVLVVLRDGYLSESARVDVRGRCDALAY